MAKTNEIKNQRVPVIFSLRLRIILVALVPIIGIAILGINSYKKASEAIISAYREQTQQTAEVLNEYIYLITESEKEEFKSYLAEQDLNMYFKDILDHTKAVSAKASYMDKLRDKLIRDSKLSNIYFISDGGRSIVTQPGAMVDDAYTPFAESEAGKKVLDNPYDWHLFGNNPQLDAAIGTDTNYALRWVRKFKDTPQAMFIDFSATRIRECLAILDAGDAGYVAIVTTDGAEFFSDETITETGLIFGQSFYTDAISAEAESGNQIVSLKGQNYLFVFSQIDESGNMVAALIPEADMIAQTAEIKQVALIIAIIAAIVAVMLALIISGQISRTIKYILRKLAVVASGDLTTHLTPKGRDEFALLCHGINDTVENVKSLIVGVNEISSQVESAAVHMSDASETFKATSGEIRKAADKIEIGAGKLDNNSSDCLEQMDNLSARISEVSVNANEIERLTGQTSQTIADGIKSVEGLTDSATATAKITGEVITAISELEKKSNSIHDIVTSINGIAKQTNLLSLNAGIEAARAGEAGRGFTVVASEIRELSAQCMSAANQISTIVDEIIGKTADVVKIAGQASTVVDSQTEVVEKTKESFVEINEQVNGLIDALSIISQNVSVMDVSREQTLHSIESITAVSSETAACSDEVNSATGTQSAAIDNLDIASEELMNKAEKLVAMLGSFKIVDEENVAD